MYDHLKTSLDLFSSDSVPSAVAISEPPYLRNLRLDFESFVQKLNDLARDCTTQNGRHMKAMKLKWFRRKAEVIALRDRCRALARQLEFAVSTFQLSVLQSVPKPYIVER
jgi:hypothetical protein